MRSIQLITTLLAATFYLPVLAQDIEQEAARNGFRPLPTVSGGAAVSTVKKTELVYVKITDPRQRISVLGTAVGQAQQTSSYTVLNFEIDCAKGALKYVSVQAIDAPWNLRTSSLALPKTVWHKPTQGSVPAQALDFACKA